MINISKKSECCGCKACEQACPVNSIEMKSDQEGFWYPYIDSERCISCDKCERVCPIVNRIDYSNNIVAAYAAKSANMDFLMKSSSGALFSEIAIKVLNESGIVFGAAFDKNYQVIHKYIDTIKDLKELQGSKYVQSDIGKTYIKVREFLNNNRLVLFSGTACQIAGLKHYLSMDYDNLITIDVLCHGVPSPLVWKKYLVELESKLQIKELKSFSFRDKSKSWYDYRISLNYNDEREYSEFFLNNPYMKLFLRDISLRPSCYDCKFKNLSRPSDITLGDCWGIENVMPEMYSEKGVSVVIVHNDKGKKIIDSLSGKIDIKEYDVDMLLPPTADSRNSVECPKNRSKFFSKVAKTKNISSLMYLTEPSFCRKIIHIIKKSIQRNI